MTAAEYLEKLFAESFKRELDQDENVVRSLPFFATALALTVTLLGFAVHSLPPINGDLWSYRTVTLFAVGLLLLGTGWTFVGVLRYLFEAIRPRTYVIPPPETELSDWEAELRSFHATAGLTGDDLEKAIVTDLRDLMIAEYAKAATTNRANNIAKMFARPGPFPSRDDAGVLICDRRGYIHRREGSILPCPEAGSPRWPTHHRPRPDSPTNRGSDSRTKRRRRRASPSHRRASTSSRGRAFPG